MYSNFSVQNLSSSQFIVDVILKKAFTTEVIRRKKYKSPSRWTARDGEDESDDTPQGREEYYDEPLRPGVDEEVLHEALGEWRLVGGLLSGRVLHSSYLLVLNAVT